MMENGRKVKNMKVYVGINVYVGDCATKAEAKRRAKKVAEKAFQSLDPWFDASKWYEEYEDPYGNKVTPEDEE